MRGEPAEIDSEVFRDDGPRRALWEDGWRRTDALLGEIAAEVSRLGARLVVVSFTSPTEVKALYLGAHLPEAIDARRPSRRVSEICARRGIPFVDLVARFGGRPTPELARVHLKYDGHWSELGHRWAAEETARFLVTETGLWREVLARAAGPR